MRLVRASNHGMTWKSPSSSRAWRSSTTWTWPVSSIVQAVPVKHVSFQSTDPGLSSPRTLNQAVSALRADGPPLKPRHKRKRATGSERHLRAVNTRFISGESFFRARNVSDGSIFGGQDGGREHKVRSLRRRIKIPRETTWCFRPPSLQESWSLTHEYQIDCLCKRPRLWRIITSRVRPGSQGVVDGPGPAYARPFAQFCAPIHG